MGWFEHRHYWRPKTALNTVIDPVGKTTGGLIIEDCTCGVVRTIEFYPGRAAIVRLAQIVDEQQD